MLNELNIEDKISVINERINSHLKLLADGMGNIEDINSKIAILKQELDNISI